MLTHCKPNANHYKINDACIVWMPIRCKIYATRCKNTDVCDAVCWFDVKTTLFQANAMKYVLHGCEINVKTTPFIAKTVIYALHEC